jgi:hypothetical protein
VKQLDRINVRRAALKIVIRAVGTIKGWEIKTAGEFLAEAEIIERWILTGDKNEKGKAAQAPRASTEKDRPARKAPARKGSKKGDRRPR